MSTRYEMHIRVKSDPAQKWYYFDEKKTIKALHCYDMYARNILYDAKIIEVTTTKKTVKESTGE